METNNTDAPEEAPWRMKRRDAMRRLLAVAGAAVAGVAVLRPERADAATGTMQYGAGNNAGGDSTAVTSTNATSTLVVQNTGGGTSIAAESSTGRAGLFRQTSGAANADGVEIEKLGASGMGLRVHAYGNGAGAYVYREHATASPAIRVTQAENGATLEANASAGSNASPLIDGYHHGVGRGIQLALTNTANTQPAIHVSQAGTGRVMFGAITNAANAQHAISAQTAGSGYALYGNTKGAGAGLGLNGGSKGRGAVIVSNVAHMRLVPSWRSTHPTSGATGDLFVDKSRRLWFCKGGTSWKQLA